MLQSSFSHIIWRQGLYMLFFMSFIFLDWFCIQCAYFLPCLWIQSCQIFDQTWYEQVKWMFHFVKITKNRQLILVLIWTKTLHAKENSLTHWHIHIITIVTLFGVLCHVEWMSSYHKTTIREASSVIKWYDVIYYDRSSYYCNTMFIVLYVFFCLIMLNCVSFYGKREIFTVMFAFPTSLVLDVTVLLPLFQTTLSNVAAKTRNRRKLGWWYGIGKRE